MAVDMTSRTSTPAEGSAESVSLARLCLSGPRAHTPSIL